MNSLCDQLGNVGIQITQSSFRVGRQIIYWTAVFASSAVSITQITVATPAPAQVMVKPAEVRSLPGKLDRVPLFNSNSPEWVKQEGILLSTFPQTGKKVANAHLNFPLNGEFNVFAHHFTHTPKDLQTLYLGVIVQNPGQRSVTLQVHQAASYLMEPDAPYQSQPNLLENPTGAIFSGPGIRAVDMVLRGQRQSGFPVRLVIPPGQSRMLMNLPIPVRGTTRSLNGRSTFLRLHSDDRLYLASMAMFAKKLSNGSDRAPTLKEWQQLLNQGGLALPRDKIPTPPNQSGTLIYGRVAGVQGGSSWRATLVDQGKQYMAIPLPNRAIAYPISTLRAGHLGTSRQSAPLLVRYADTAYEAHGNYGVHYDLTLPLKNTTAQSQTVTLTLATPLKEDVLSQAGLKFRNPPLGNPGFRGTVRLRTVDRQGQTITRYIHIWHLVGQAVPPLLSLPLAPQEERSVQLDFLYPPDALPPQVLLVETQS